MVDEGVSEKHSLLSQLKIDRDEKEDGGLSIPVVIILLLIALAAGLGGGMFFFGPDAPSAEPQSSVAKDAAAAVPAKVNNRTGAHNGGDNYAAVAAGSRLSTTAAGDQSILDASGYITARRIATVSAELTGRITEVLVEEGMRVEEGQILAHLDDAIARVNLGLAEARMAAAAARLESARASLAEAERGLARTSKLKSNDYSSEASLTSSRLNVETSRADLNRAIADLEVARLDVSRQRELLDDYTIRAPFSGVVTIKNAQPGEIVAPGSAGGGFTRTGICTIVDMASLEIEADVNEAFIGRIFSGQRVRANLDAYPDWDIPARVIAIIPTANRNKATVRVRIGLEVEDQRILPDMGVKIAFYGSS